MLNRFLKWDLFILVVMLSHSYVMEKDDGERDKRSVCLMKD